MKKTTFAFLVLCSSFAILSCNDSNDNANDTSNDTANNMNTAGDTANTFNNTNAGTTVNTTPLNREDSLFVMEAAVGGIMEVESGNLAQQNATSQRVKDFGAMMVADHSKANSELKSLVGSRVMIPDSLPADKKKHVEQMRKMKGKSFDNHYLNMMVDDHKKTIAKFQKQSQSGADAQLKNWATATLPTLQKHLDSVQAIKKGN